MELFIFILCLCFAFSAYAIDFSDVQKEDNGTYTIRYKKTVEDINGKEVTIPVNIQKKTKEQIEEEISYHEAQKLNHETHIARLQKELEEIKKVDLLISE